MERKRGFVFSLDAFFALIVFMIAFAILLYANRAPFHYYYISLQAKLLASDIASAISHLDLAEEQDRACFYASNLLRPTTFRYAIYVDGVRLDCSEDDSLYKITRQSAFLLTIGHYSTGENPYRYHSCSGEEVPCEPLNRSHPVEPPALLPVRVVVFI